MRQAAGEHTLGGQINRIWIKGGSTLGDGLRSQCDYNQQKQHLRLVLQLTGPRTTTDTSNSHQAR